MQNYPPSEPKSCRICLEDDSSNSQSFISPCKCSGTLKYVHQQCLLNWLNTSLLRSPYQDASGTQACCQIQIKTIISFNSYSEFKEQFNENRIVFILALISILGSLGCIVYFSQQMSEVDLSINNDSPNKYLLIAGTPILVFMAILVSVKWIMNFFLKKTVKFLLIREKQSNDLALENTASTFPRN